MFYPLIIIQKIASWLPEETAIQHWTEINQLVSRLEEYEIEREEQTEETEEEQEYIEDDIHPVLWQFLAQVITVFLYPDKLKGEMRALLINLTKGNPIADNDIAFFKKNSLASGFRGTPEERATTALCHAIYLCLQPKSCYMERYVAALTLSEALNCILYLRVSYSAGITDFGPAIDGFLKMIQMLNLTQKYFLRN
jgi:hypothetical protein